MIKRGTYFGVRVTILAEEGYVRQLLSLMIFASHSSRCTRPPRIIASFTGTSTSSKKHYKNAPDPNPHRTPLIPPSRRDTDLQQHCSRVRH